MIFATVALLSTSCATIVSRSRYNVSINSAPSGANVRILNRRGVEVANGFTPMTVRLKAKSGFFRAAEYTIIFNKEGYEESHRTIDAELKPWYFGNILFGGPIGFLIIDPLSGAMWKIEDTYITQTLMPKATPLAEAKPEKGGKSIQVYSINDIPNEWRERMARVN